MNDHAHFEGKDVKEHLKAAREKGAAASSEIHGTEPSGAFAACCDSTKSTAALLLILGTLLPGIPLKLFIIFGLALLIWHFGRSALLGWFRLERLHRLIEEERWEIEHHRAQEREELTAMYRAKGLSGKLLEEVIDVLMADDNRLLMVMLEEELNLSLESFEHPLQQAFGALIGSLSSAILAIGGFWLGGLIGLGIGAAITFFVASLFMAKRARSQKISYIIWNIALLAITFGTAYFVGKMVS